MMPTQHYCAAGVPELFPFLNTEASSTPAVLKKQWQDNWNCSLDTKVSVAEGASVKAKGTDSLHLWDILQGFYILCSLIVRWTQWNLGRIFQQMHACISNQNKISKTNSWLHSSTTCKLDEQWIPCKCKDVPSEIKCKSSSNAATLLTAFSYDYTLQETFG